MPRDSDSVRSLPLVSGPLKQSNCRRRLTENWFRMAFSKGGEPLKLTCMNTVNPVFLFAFSSRHQRNTLANPLSWAALSHPSRWKTVPPVPGAYNTVEQKGSNPEFTEFYFFQLKLNHVKRTAAREEREG